MSEELHVVPMENSSMPQPTFFQRYIGPSLVAMGLTVATLIFGFGGSAQRVENLTGDIEDLKRDRKDFATKDDVRRVEEAVKDIQKDVKDILREKK